MHAASCKDIYGGRRAARRMPRDAEALGRTGSQGSAGAPNGGPVYSPPLSPEEIADIEAIASGAVKLRRMSKEEFLRMIDRATGFDAQGARRVR